MLMAGLAKGLGGSLGLVEKQIQTVSTAITDTFEKALPTARTLTIGTDSLIGGYSNKTPQLANATSSSYAVPTSNTYIFNSPEAVTPTVAAKLLKQTAQQMALNIK